MRAALEEETRDSLMGSEVPGVNPGGNLGGYMNTTAVTTMNNDLTSTTLREPIFFTYDPPAIERKHGLKDPTTPKDDYEMDAD